MTQLPVSASPVTHLSYSEDDFVVVVPKNLLSDRALRETLDKCSYSHGTEEQLWHCPCSSPLQMLLVSPNTWAPAG